MFGKHMTLRRSLMLSISALILLCITVTVLVSNSLYSDATIKQNSAYALQLLEQTQRNIDTYVRSARTQLLLLSDEPEVRAFFALSGQSGDQASFSAELSARNVLRGYSSRMPYIYGLLLTGENGSYVSNEFYSEEGVALNEQSWYVDCARGDYPKRVVSRPEQRGLRTRKKYTADDVVMLNYPVRGENGELLGVVSADLATNELKESFMALNTGQSSVIFVLDRDGDMVYAPPEPIIAYIDPQWFFERTEPFSSEVNGREMTFLFSVSSFTGWKTISMLSNDTPPALIVTLRRAVLLVAFLALSLGMALALILTNSVARPISNLRRLMRRAELGDLAAHYAPCGSPDIDRLGASFNAMIDRLRALMADVVQEQKNKQKAEMSALQAQINPHFLYNTLDTIHWMARDYDAADIEQLVAALTRLFRISLSGGREFITLAEEIAHVQNYLYIQKVRYQNKLDYSIETDEALLCKSVLKIIIQPLVENALYHGIKPKAGNGSVRIRVYRQNNALCVDVTDDGVGLSEERFNQINRDLADREKNSGFGMFNVNERLNLYFGAAYGVRLEQNACGGVTSALRHPLLDSAPN